MPKIKFSVSSHSHAYYFTEFGADVFIKYGIILFNKIYNVKNSE